MCHSLGDLCVASFFVQMSCAYWSMCHFRGAARGVFWMFHLSVSGCSMRHFHTGARGAFVTKLFTGLVLAGSSLIFIIPFQPSQLFKPSQPNGLHSITEEMMRQEITEREPHKLQPHIVHHTTTDNRYIVDHNTKNSSSHHQNSSEPTSTGGNDGIRAEKRHQQRSPARFSEGRDCSLLVTSSCPHTVVGSSAALPLLLHSSS